MSGTVKTVLIVVGAGVGAFLLVKLLAPPKVATGRTQPNSATPVQLGGLAAIVGGALSMFGGGGGAPSSSGGAYSDPASQAAIRDFDSDNSSVSDGFIFTDRDGTFIAG